MMRGGCHCGKVRFEITGQPNWLGRCHCHDCQKISGTAYMAYAGFGTKQVSFLSEKPKEYKSSAAVTRTFCDVCGSPIEWKKDDEPQNTALSLGLFDEDPNFDLTNDLYEENSPSWAKHQA